MTATDTTTILELTRLDRGLTQTALAEQAGVDRVTIIRLEGRRHPPKAETLKRLADALDCDWHDLDEEGVYD